MSMDKATESEKETERYNGIHHPRQIQSPKSTVMGNG